MTFPRRLALALVPPLVAAACGSSGPTGPTATTPLPFVRETATMRIYYEPGDSVDADWQDAFNAWAIERLGVAPPKVEYRKYVSRDAMGRYTGHYNTNGFAEPDQWRLHTLWPRDNHEVVHLYSAMLGRPSDFFNEGFAVAFQADPVTGHLESVFNGVEVHTACRDYLRSGQLPLPVANYATTTPFRGLQDQVMSYRYAGSFVRFLIDRFGLAATLQFMRGNGSDESLAAIRTRAEAVFGRTFDQIEADWVAMLRQ